MRGYRALLGLVVVVLAVLGAVLHPLALLLSRLPLKTESLVSFLDSTKAFIADLLGWALLALLALMLALVVLGRLRRKGWISAKTSFEPIDPSDGDPCPSRIAVAITAYNDAEATADAVRQFKAQPGVIEVLVIDNNSQDDTAELARAAGARVIREYQQGYGYACIRGLREAARVPGAEVVVLTEGDGTFVGRDIPKLQSYIGQSDMVVGSRVSRVLVQDGSQMDYFFTWGNIAVAYLLRLRCWDAQFLGVAGLNDVGCTLRAIRRKALEEILPELAVGGNHFLPHMMLVALAHGLTVVEVPITFKRRIGQSKGASQSLGKGFKVGLAMIWHILTYRPGVKPGYHTNRPSPREALESMPELEPTKVVSGSR
jgi:hypothetical protein